MKKLLFLLIILTIYSCKNESSKKNLSTVNYKGLSIELPEEWNSVKKELVKGEVYQVSCKNLTKENRKGIVFTFSNKNPFGNSIEESILKFQSNFHKQDKNVMFFDSEENKFNGVDCMVLPYIINHKAENEVKGNVFFFEYKSHFFSIDIKANNLLESYDILEIEKSFNFNI